MPAPIRTPFSSESRRLPDLAEPLPCADSGERARASCSGRDGAACVDASCAAAGATGTTRLHPAKNIARVILDARPMLRLLDWSQTNVSDSGKEAHPSG